MSSLCFPEIISALNRRLRDKSINRSDYPLIKDRIIYGLNSVDIINVVPEVISKAIILLEKNNLRTLAAIHIASAQIWHPELFISSDKKQILAAQKIGLKVKYVE